MPIPGFDPKWKDFPAYIIGITKEIWEDRNIHSLHDLYTHDIPVRSPGSVVVGNKDVIGATMATLAEFPDRTLLGEDVIWSGDPDTGLLSSHRILSTATHVNSGLYGQATGKRLQYRIIADCAARNNRIYDEWLVRDQGAIVRQLGQNPKDYARDLIKREGGAENCVRPLTQDNNIDGPYKGTGNDSETGARYAAIITRIMNAELSAVPKEYDRACHLELPGGVTAHGHQAADRFWMGLRASFPNAVLKFDHIIGREDAGHAPRAALRWSLSGRHEGRGCFGQPTGANVYLLGISHAEFGPYGLRREYLVFDETAVWKQILMQTG